MIINACYITGFGGLKDVDFTFEDGLNQILEENGWGKTSFAVFIKAMFYGMEYSPRKKDLTEREHYMPWDGGICGGSLTFTNKEGQFRIERTFGKKDSEDTYRLIDCATGKESSAYSEEIGTELFGVDRDSFEKSIFVPQAKAETSMTDSLNAKMGDLAAARDDINSFEAAIQRLEDAKKEYTRSSKVNPGKLVAIREDIRKSRAIVEEIPSITDAYEQKKAQLTQREGELSKLQGEKEILSKEIAERSKQEQSLGAYREKLSLLEKNRDILSELDDYFAKGFPSEDEQKLAEEEEAQLRVDKASLEDRLQKLPSQEERERLAELFQDGIPTEEELNNYQEQADRLKELRMQAQSASMSEEDKRKLSQLRDYFKPGIPTREEMKALQSRDQERQQLIGQRKVIEERRHKDESQQEKQAKENMGGKGNRLLAIVLGIVFLLGGFTFITMLGSEGSRLAGYTFLGIGAFCFFMSILLSSNSKKKERQKAEAVMTRLEEYEEQLRDIDDQLENSTELEHNFLELYPGKEESLMGRVQEVQRLVDQYLLLKKREQDSLSVATGALDELSELQLSLYTALQPYATSYGIDLYHDMKEQELLKDLRNDAATEQSIRSGRDERAELEMHISETRLALASYVDRFPILTSYDENGEETEITVKDRLHQIRKNIDRYTRLTENTEELEQEIAAIRRSPEFPKEGLSVEELQNKQTELDDKIAEMNRFIQTDMEEVSNLSESLVSHEEERDHLADEEEEEGRLKERVNVLNRTRDYLEKARERFLSRYMKPLQNGMQTYLTELYGETEEPALSEEEFMLDMDLGIRFVHQGQTRTNAYLSAGYKDLTSLAARMALVDVLYRKEQPVIILDDPFTNLDKEKVEAGMNLLKKQAKNRQIIYFTCHESRM